MRKKQNGGWKLSDTDWFYFSFYNPSWVFFYDPSWSESNFILFLFFYSIRVGPSRSELIRPGLAVRVDPHPVRLLYPPIEVWLDNKCHKIYLSVPFKIFCLNVILTISAETIETSSLTLPTDFSRSLFNQIETFSGILTAYFNCNYYP